MIFKTVFALFLLKTNKKTTPESKHINGKLTSARATLMNAVLRGVSTKVIQELVIYGCAVSRVGPKSRTHGAQSENAKNSIVAVNHESGSKHPN